MIRIPGSPILPGEPSLISCMQGELSSRPLKQGQKKDVTWLYLRLAVVYQTVETERLITSGLLWPTIVCEPFGQCWCRTKKQSRISYLLCTPSIIFFTCQASHSAAQNSRFCPFLFNIFWSLTNHQRISSPPADAARQDYKCGGETIPCLSLH